MPTTRPPLDGLRILKLAVSDCDRSLDFYERVFGAERIERADHRDAGGAIYAYICDVPGFGKIDLRLLPEHAAVARKMDPISLHIADKATLDRWAEFLDGLGDVHHSGVFATGLSWAIGVEDPDGRVIKLFSREGHGPEIPATPDNPWMKN